jgi:formylglycine-generating enzyme required for sulfatase activity
MPTEAEWEYACRAGATAEANCSFHFYLTRPTNDLSSDQANFDGSLPFGDAPKGPALGRPTKVGSYAPNALGLYDMHGNVWQWCQDKVGDGGRVLRGGSWYNSGEKCRASYQFGRPQSFREDKNGFRLVRVVSAER